MDFWQWVQVLVGVGAMVLIIEFRNVLRKKGNFSDRWNLLSGVVVGICIGAVSDAVITPSRFTNFGLTAFLVTMIYVKDIGKNNVPST